MRFFHHDDMDVIIGSFGRASALLFVVLSLSVFKKDSQFVELNVIGFPKKSSGVDEDKGRQDHIILDEVEFTKQFVFSYDHLKRVAKNCRKRSC